MPGILAKESGATIRTGAMVRELARTEREWRLTIGSAAAPERLDADAVILAVPARPAARLLAGVAGAGAAVIATAALTARPPVIAPADGTPATAAIPPAARTAANN